MSAGTEPEQEARFDRAAVLTAAGPEMEALKAEIRAAARSLKRLMRWLMALPIGFFASGIIGAFTPLGFLGAAPMIALVFGAMAALVVVGLRAAGRIFAARAEVMRAIAPALGLDYAKTPAAPVDFTAFAGTYHGANLKWSRVRDVLSGVRRGVRFQIFDAQLVGRSKGPDGAWRAGEPPKWMAGLVFNVTRVVRVEAPGRWSARTVVVRDYGLANRLTRPQGLSKVRLVDPEFEAVFEVYSDDQTEARALLTPDLMHRLKALEDLFAPEATGDDAPPPTIAAFEAGVLMVALALRPPKGADLVAGRLTDEAVDAFTTETILMEIDAVLRIAEAIAPGG